MLFQQPALDNPNLKVDDFQHEVHDMHDLTHEQELRLMKDFRQNSS